jgi:endo-1,4-beta-xylanase
MHAPALTRRKAAASICLAAATTAALLAVAPPATAAPAAPAQAAASSAAQDQRSPGLGELAAKRHLRFGTAVNVDALASDPAYRTVLSREFSSVTPENAMKWESIEPTRGVLDFTASDTLVTFATRQHQVVRGHTLVWHNQIPGWLTSGTFTNAELEALLRKHIIEEARHFRGRIDAWDVLNEAFNEDGTLRDTIWLRALGPDYIAKTFIWAHQGDPHAKLYYNDFNLESIGPKSNAAFALVQNLQSRGIRIDGVGFQGHLDIQFGFPNTFGANLARFAALGVDVAVTEADVRMFVPPDATKLATQATYFTNMLDSCLAVRRCVSFTVWGFDDGHSWVPGVFTGEGAATPFDESFQPKPAYFAMRDSLTGGA